MENPTRQHTQITILATNALLESDRRKMASSFYLLDKQHRLIRKKSEWNKDTDTTYNSALGESNC